jgi:hypothetical protein
MKKVTLYSLNLSNSDMPEEIWWGISYKPGLFRILTIYILHKMRKKLGDSRCM